jgi:hypothetical protein
MADFGQFRGFGDKLFQGQLPSKLGAIGSNGLFLDFYPNAQAAYSLRKLRSNYNGNVIRVRRSSDNTEQNIGFDLANNIDTSALLTFCGSGNGFVTTWYDQSGNARNATQTTAANQPQIVLDGSILNDGVKNSILWANNGDNNLVFSRISTIKSVFQVGKINQQANYMSCVLGDTEFNEYHGDLTTYLLNSSLTDNTQNGVNRINGSIVNLRTLTRTLNRNLISMIHQNATNRANQIAQNAFPAQRSWRGYISELIIYTTDQTNNITNIESDINSYYGIY